jgi:hypothetical protein
MNQVSPGIRAAGGGGDRRSVDRRRSSTTDGCELKQLPEGYVLIPESELEQLRAEAEAQKRAAADLLFDFSFHQAVNRGLVPESERGLWRAMFNQHGDAAREALEHRYAEAA